MNRQEKKAIRLEISSILDKDCKPCRKVKKNSYRTHSYCHKECPAGIKMLELSKKLGGEGKAEIVKSKAGRPQGNKTRHWSEEDELYLINHFYELGIDAVSKKLNRTVTAIESKISHLRKKGKWVNKNVR